MILLVIVCTTTGEITDEELDQYVIEEFFHFGRSWGKLLNYQDAFWMTLTMITQQTQLNDLELFSESGEPKQTIHH